jgi:hypothetical protein
MAGDIHRLHSAAKPQPKKSTWMNRMHRMDERLAEPAFILSILSIHVNILRATPRN